MADTFKEIIRSFHSVEIPYLVPRQLDMPILPKSVRKAWIFIGLRRSGKTYTLYQIMRTMLSQNIDPTKLVYSNVEDDRLCDMHISHLQNILDAYYDLYPQQMSGLMGMSCEQACDAY